MKNRVKYLKMLTVLFIGTILLLGCRSDQKENNGIPQIVTTSTMITDLTRTIGGDQVSVIGLMGPGIDPHGFNASASDVNHIYESDIVIYNGMHLEGQMGRVFSELEKLNKTVFVLENVIHSTEMLDTDEEDTPIDPHIWFSVPLWARAAHYVTESLALYRPEHATYFEANNEAYQIELERLDQYIRNRISEIPEDQRYLVTAHDAFQYFGKEYEFEVIGLQGLNTQTEAGTRDVSRLAEFIAEQQIKAVFVESSVPTRTIESLQEAVQQRGWDVEIGGELFSDSLGDVEQQAETYIKMYKKNIDTIVDALK